LARRGDTPRRRDPATPVVSLVNGSSRVMKTLIKALAAKLGVGIFKIRDRYAQDGLFTVHNDHFRADPAFRAAYGRGVQASHGVDPDFEWRVHVALWAAHTGLRVEGDFVECGVNAGFVSSAIMEKLQWNTLGRRFYLIDTFAGPVLTQYSQEEVQKQRHIVARHALEAGAYVTDIHRIRANFAEWRNAIIVQGQVPEVLHRVEFGSVAFLHIDMNCALPERTALEFFWDRLSAGAVVLLDDYAYYGHECQRDAIDAAARVRGAEVLSLPTGQGVIIR
jgi:methyltransferase family protein